jgi:sodium-dependent phosphate cotransporter
LTVLLLLFVFLVGVRALGDGFKLLGANILESFFLATANPFVGLMVGILATTLVQSSSVTTSMVVGLVAAPENALPVANAIPMIMGANIGTTVTNTIVSLAHMGEKREFRRAYAVATCHDFFNFMAVMVLLPLEILTGAFGRMAGSLAAVMSGAGGLAFESPLKGLLKTGAGPISATAKAFLVTPMAQGSLVVICSGVLILFGLLMLVRTLRAALITNLESRMEGILGGTGVTAMVLGVIVTVMVQSSSITTSLLIPFAAAGALTLRQAFPVTLGANVGTTVTALMASLAVTGVNAQAGITIALVHLLFNVMGTAIIYPFAAVRAIPLRLAESLADIAVRSKSVAIGYTVLMFYGIPALFAFLTR